MRTAPSKGLRPPIRSSAISPAPPPLSSVHARWTRAIAPIATMPPHAEPTVGRRAAARRSEQGHRSAAFALREQLTRDVELCARREQDDGARADAQRRAARMVSVPRTCTSERAGHSTRAWATPACTEIPFAADAAGSCAEARAVEGRAVHLQQQVTRPRKCALRDTVAQLEASAKHAPRAIELLGDDAAFDPPLPPATRRLDAHGERHRDRLAARATRRDGRRNDLELQRRRRLLRRSVTHRASAGCVEQPRLPPR